MRKLVLIAMVLMICLSTAIWAQENDSAVSRGMAHMAKQQYAEAILEFQEAKKLFPDVIDLDFMIGFAANNIGDYPLAIVSFQRVVSEMPSSRAKLELARAYMGESVEHFPSAKSLFQEVLEDNPSPELANAIHDLMSRMEIAGRMPPSGIAPPGVRSGHSFNGRLSSGISIDSNPYSNPGNYLISSIIGNLQFEPAGEGKWDVANISQINLAHAYRFNNTRLAWKTDGLLYGSFYADNMMYTQLRTGLAYEGERFGVEALGRFVHMEQDNRAELQSWGGEINTHFFINENFALFSGWRHDVKQRIRTTFRSGTSDGLFLGTMFQLNDRHRINIFSGMELERLHLDEESFRVVSWFEYPRARASTVD